jgi:phosphopantothenoylcysteine decarboxylase/phosphopantothenate--cysteine ligase
MARVAVGVTGGIGAYKAVELVRLLQARDHEVRVVLTRNATRFVRPLTFEAITRAPVITSQFAPGLNANIEHIALASSLDALIVAPATANILGKFAHGIADDFLSSLYLATRAPVLVAPAMNTNMWEHDAVRANLAVLRARGVSVVDPDAGYLACGWIGPGRLAEPETIARAVDTLLSRSTSLAGRTILVTAGPTAEDIDAVRFIGNRSSGRMGFAVAAEAARRGAQVTLVVGPTAVPPPLVSELVRVRSAHEMRDVVVSKVSAADAVVMAAAVADYTPANGVRTGKIEKGEPLTLVLERTPDILAELGRTRGALRRPVLVGFAAQVGDLAEAARRKLRSKSVDLIVANDVSRPDAGFDVETNRVTLVSADGEQETPLLSKREVAEIILDRIEILIGASSSVTV